MISVCLYSTANFAECDLQGPQVIEVNVDDAQDGNTGENLDENATASGNDLDSGTNPHQSANNEISRSHRNR